MSIVYSLSARELSDEILNLLLTTDSNKSRVEQAWKSGLHFLALEGEQLAGVAVVNLQAPVAELTNIAVAQSYQCKGVARRLIDKIKEYALEQGKSCLKVDTDRTSAHQFEFYQKWGFKPYRESDTDITSVRVMIIDLC